MLHFSIGTMYMYDEHIDALAFSTHRVRPNQNRFYTFAKFFLGETKLTKNVTSIRLVAMWFVVRRIFTITYRPYWYRNSYRVLFVHESKIMNKNFAIYKNRKIPFDLSLNIKLPFWSVEKKKFFLFYRINTEIKTTKNKQRDSRLFRI